MVNQMMKHLGFMLAILFLLSGSINAATPVATAAPSTANGDELIRLELRRAEEYLQNGQYLEALGQFDTVAGLTTDSRILGECHFKMGGIYGYFLDQKENAFREYQKVLDSAADEKYVAEATFNCGMVQYELKKPAEALRYFTTYLQKFGQVPNRVTAEFMLEQCQMEMEEGQKTPGPGGTASGKAQCLVDVDVSKPVRVLLEADAKSLTIDGRGEASVSAEKTEMTMPLPLTVKVEGKSIRVNNREYDVGSLTITAKQDFLGYKGINYRGRFTLRTEAGRLSLINAVLCEDYLQGVLPREMAASWSIEALKAQAVSARTYVLFQAEKNRDKPYDVSPTTASQVYGGQSAEKESTNKAVTETTGKVLCYESKLIISCFHSNSGGYTESARHVWIADMPYLKGVSDQYSQGTPNLEWEISFSLEELESKLGKRGITVGDLKDITIHETSDSGRAITLKLVGSKGERIIKSNDFRLMIDPMLVKSTKFTISRKGGTVTFTGSGFGHGVGMPQWSAQKMSQAGHSYTEILQKYFHDVDIIKLY
jgi:stage II sporulation protein D